MYIKKFFVLMLCGLIVACANTTVIQSWVETEPGEAYKRPLVIGMSDSQQTRRIYEDYVVAKFRKKHVIATPSYTLISSKQDINRDTVVAAIKDSDIDSVLVSYLVSAKTETVLRESPLNTGYSGNNEDLQLSATIITNPGRYNEEEIITLKHDLYDVATGKIVWALETRSVAVDSIDEIVTDVTALIIKQLYNDKVF